MGEGVQLILKKGHQGATALRQAISTAVPEAKVSGQGVPVVVHVKGLDADVTGDEVLNAIVAQFPSDGAMPSVVAKVNLRPAFQGTQNASLVLQPEIAKKMVEAGTIRVGWSSCRVQLPDRDHCFKCWMKGHKANECTGPDRSSSCFRCGEPGHQAVTCTADRKCWSCGKAGHLALSGKCNVGAASENGDKTTTNG